MPVRKSARGYGHLAVHVCLGFSDFDVVRVGQLLQDCALDSGTRNNALVAQRLQLHLQYCQLLDPRRYLEGMPVV